MGDGATARAGRGGDVLERAASLIRQRLSSPTATVLSFAGLDFSRDSDVERLVALLQASPPPAPPPPVSPLPPAAPKAAAAAALCKVSLEQCRLTGRGATAVAEWAASLSGSSQLDEISFANNKSCMEGGGGKAAPAAEALACAVTRMARLERLWLSHTGLDCHGVGVLASALCHSHSLRVIGLEGNDAIGAAGEEALAAGLARNTSVISVRLGSYSSVIISSSRQRRERCRAAIRGCCERNELALRSLAPRQRLAWALAGLSRESGAAAHVLPWDLLSKIGGAQLRQLQSDGGEHWRWGTAVAAQKAATKLRLRWCREGGRAMLACTRCDTSVHITTLGICGAEWSTVRMDSQSTVTDSRSCAIE
jgi:hypothetical protein